MWIMFNLNIAIIFSFQSSSYFMPFSHLETRYKKEGIMNVIYLPTHYAFFLYINPLYTFLEAIVIVNVTQVYFIGVAY